MFSSTALNSVSDPTMRKPAPHFIAAAFAITLACATAQAAPTFNKDVLPILQKNCQECHRPNAIAPMSFMSYKESRPYARAIAKAVVARTMPPITMSPKTTTQAAMQRRWKPVIEARARSSECGRAS